MTIGPPTLARLRRAALWAGLTCAAHAHAEASAIEDARRAIAAQATAGRHPACTAIQPFYWEVGRAAGRLAGGTAGGTAPTRESVMLLASATKLLYASYVAERRDGVPNAADVKALTLRSGYTSFSGCAAGDSVGRCQSTGSNGRYDAAHDGRFYYDGAQMQQHAADPAGMGLAALDNAGLGAELRSRLGAEIELEFVRPQPAAGGIGTPAGYARVLQKIVAGQLRMRALLGTSAVHTHPGRYPAEAIFTPIPPNESWRYSIGHWVEDDPAVGDGAFSSPGVFGFYPWIDAGRTTYGLVARAAFGGIASAMRSVACGRLIRKAWFTATELVR